MIRSHGIRKIMRMKHTSTPHVLLRSFFHPLLMSRTSSFSPRSRAPTKGLDGQGDACPCCPCRRATRPLGQPSGQGARLHHPHILDDVRLLVRLGLRRRFLIRSLHFAAALASLAAW